jgi:hypothetical protein
MDYFRADVRDLNQCAKWAEEILRELVLRVPRYTKNETNNITDGKAFFEFLLDADTYRCRIDIKNANSESGYLSRFRIDTQDKKSDPSYQVKMYVSLNPEKLIEDRKICTIEDLRIMLTEYLVPPPYTDLENIKKWTYAILFDEVGIAPLETKNCPDGKLEVIYKVDKEKYDFKDYYIADDHQVYKTELCRSFKVDEFKITTNRSAPFNEKSYAIMLAYVFDYYSDSRYPKSIYFQSEDDLRKKIKRFIRIGSNSATPTGALWMRIHDLVCAIEALA